MLALDSLHLVTLQPSFWSQNLAEAILRVKHPPLNIGQRGFFQSMYKIKVAGIFPRQFGSAIFDLLFFSCFFPSHRWFEDDFFSDFGRFFRWRSFFSDVVTSGGLSLKLLSLVTNLLPVASCTVTRPVPVATFRGSEGNTKTAWPWYSGFCFRCNHTCRWEKGSPQRVGKFWRAQGTIKCFFEGEVEGWIFGGASFLSLDFDVVLITNIMSS